MITTLEKRQKLKESLRKTKEKRKNQNSKLCQLKIPYSNLNKSTDCENVKLMERKATAWIIGSDPYIRVSYTSVKQEAWLF